MPTFFQNTKKWIVGHKIISGIIVLIILFAGYKTYAALTSTVGQTTYVLGTVSKGTVISTVSGTGQVAASNQVNLTASGSGTILYVGAKAGQAVRKGQTLFSLDDKSAQQAVRNAEINLQSAQLGLAQLQEAPDTASVLQIKSSIANAEASKKDAQSAVDSAHRTLLNSSIAPVSNNSTNTQTPPTISGTYQKTEEGVITITVHQAGSNPYFTATSVPSDIVNTTGSVSSVVAQPVGDTGLYVTFPTASYTLNQPDWIITLPNKAAGSYAANYTAYQNALSDQAKTNASADNTIAQNNANLDLLYTPDALSVQAKQLSITQAENSLQDAKENLSDYYVSAPFDGTIATVTGQIGQTASGTLATIVTKQNLATITLNEVDVSKIKLGDKVTLTFDAIPDLSVAGEVASIDTVGTVSQGVVNYTVQIGLDTNDASIKPGMSVTANIMTAVATDVLTVPSAAVKSGAQGNYVLTFTPALASTGSTTAGVVSATPPAQTPVEIGITDDASTEIISGLKEGDQIVIRTSTTTAATTKTASATPSATSLLGGAARGGASFGGATRTATGR